MFRPSNSTLRVDLHIHGDHSLDWRLEHIETLLHAILQKEVQQMSFSQETLDAITANGTLIGSIKTLVQSLVDQGSITPEAAAAIKSALSGNKTELAAIEASLLANTNSGGGGTGSGFSLSVMVDGSGSVSKSPDQASYPAGSSVTLTATADAGFSFSGYSGDANSADPIATVTMDANKSVTATFV